MAAQDRVLKSSVGADEDGPRSEKVAGSQSRGAGRARAPVPLSHQVAGHKHGVHQVGQFTP